MSIYRKIANTPLRDILRGRLTGREDWRGVIDGAQLPLSLQKLTTKVVLRTRLRRLEKTSVAHELCASFHDGLEKGATAEELANSFGNAQSAARRIRRERKHQRHVLWRFMSRTVKIAGVVLLLLVVVYVFELIRFNMRRPTITRDYVAEINAQIEAIPEEDRAWPIYHEAILSLHPLPARMSSVWAESPDDEMWQEQTAIIHDKAQAIELFRQASQRPFFGRPWATAIEPDIAQAMQIEPIATQQTAHSLLIETTMPHYSSLRNGALLLAADARLAAFEQDSERVEKNLTALAGMSTHNKIQETIIGELVDVSIHSIMLITLHNALYVHPALFTDEQMLRMSHMLGKTSMNHQTISQHERQTFYDIIQRAYTDDGAGDGKLTPYGACVLLNFGLVGNWFGCEFGPFFGPALAHWVYSRADIVNEFDLIVAEMERVSSLPLQELVKFDDYERVERLYNDPVAMSKQELIAVYMPIGIEHTARYIEILHLERDTVRTVIALELYKRREGSYPESLEELTPHLLPELPVDRFDGQLLRYLLVDGAPLLYSVGANQKDEGGEPALDDDGVPSPDAAQNLSKRDRPGDWILHPPSY